MTAAEKRRIQRELQQDMTTIDKHLELCTGHEKRSALSKLRTVLEMAYIQYS